ncbi:hypothetical protein [Aminipila luticellarii]|uniref:DUF948 domain-containing protein n=1 Tax=Aminipila luticellarii TaxID=2507160 RepID=A0A410PWT0_9FIRM|nr:hypothetical protein [Aminipila luticellarii]QAT43326.1 hypothetical protein EQM06_08895 [Aminipila luticellarii]
MEITLTLKDLGLILIGTGIIVLLIYCIGLVKNLTVTIKHTNKILEDTQVITAIAAERAQDIDHAVEDVTETVSNISEALKGNQSTIAALSSIVNSLISLKNICTRKEKRAE